MCGNEYNTLISDQCIQFNTIPVLCKKSSCTVIDAIGSFIPVLSHEVTINILTSLNVFAQTGHLREKLLSSCVAEGTVVDRPLYTHSYFLT